MKSFEFKTKVEFKSWLLALPMAERQILLLQGEVGTGKTQCVSWLAEKFGMKQVASPSFALHHQYEAGGKVLHHFDLYRLENDDDLESTGFWDVFAAERSLVVIEWPERLKREELPRNWSTMSVEIKSLDQSERRTVTVS